MSEAEVAGPWCPPDPSECEDSWPFPMTPVGGDAKVDRVVVRMRSHIESGYMTEFAVVQEVHHKGRWVHVAICDSCHGSIHIHRYGRSDPGERIGLPDHLMDVTCLDDVGRGYDLAYERIVDDWKANKQRWHDA
jgi:hypothetical protein